MPRNGVTDDAAEILRGAEARAQRAEVVREDWSTPIPLAFEAQRFPPKLLPGALGEFAESLSDHTETPRELAGLMCLAATSASVAGRCQVEIHEGYIEPLNLFVAVALESGSRKTAVVNWARQPLIDYEREELERIAPERRRAISERKTLEARIEKLRKDVINQHDDDAAAQLLACEQSLVEIPKIPKLWTQDVTTEGLALLTSQNNERMAILSDEGGYFDILAGRYSRGVPNLDFVLQAHAGAPVRVDRKSGDPIVLANPLLTIGLSPQPSLLSGLAEVSGFRGRGLLARFLFGYPPSNLGYRIHKPSPIPIATQREYAGLIRCLLNLGSRAGEDGKPAAIKLTFEPSAYESWREFQRLVEIEMREGNRLAGFKDWAGKLPGAAARLAGLFHCVTVDCKSVSVIPRSTTELALALSSILISHAICAFGLMGASVHLETAKRLLKWTLDRGNRETTKRDVFCAFQSTFRTVDNLEPVLQLLVEHNYLRIEDRKTGGRRSQVCRWNPTLFGGAA